MLRRTRSIAFFGLVILSSSALVAQNSQLYSQAIAEFNAGDFAASCVHLRTLYDNTAKFHDLPADVVASEKAAGPQTTTWTHKALDSDSHQRYAQECAEFMRRSLSDASFNDFFMVDDGRMYADRAIAHPGALPNSAPAAAAAVAISAPTAGSARRASRALARNVSRTTSPPKAAAASAPAPQPAPASSVTAGSGNLPDGDYKCYTATTATILAGGSASLNPGQFLTHIHIKGNTYQAYEDPAGHYSVGSNGKITWNGGTYSSKTLGRYVIDGGQPAIAIGYADTDAGSVCKR